MKIVGLDPGGTTGYCVYYTETQEVAQDEIKRKDHHWNLYKTLRLDNPDVIVCEQFDYRPNQKVADLHAVEYIGVVKLYCDVYDYVELVFQTQLKGHRGLWTNDKLEAVGLYVPGMPHAMDATRQVLYYVTVMMKDHYWVNKYREFLDGN